MKFILVTGSTDGIGLEAAKLFVAKGHRVLLHGRNPEKLANVAAALGTDQVETYCADFSEIAQVKALAETILEKHKRLDVLINNAGVYKLNGHGKASRVTSDNLDVRFAVNALAPYVLTKALLPIMPKHGRIINISSAAQAPVNMNTMWGRQSGSISDQHAYAQSKMALTMWTKALAASTKQTIVALNPASLLGTKLVHEAYGIEGKERSIGATIMVQAALGKHFARATGKYFDNDTGDFQSPPHPDASNLKKCKALVSAMEEILHDSQNSAENTYCLCDGRIREPGESRRE